MPHSQLQKQQKNYLNKEYRNYDNVISYLEQNWHPSTQKSMLALHKALNHIMPICSPIIITGTSGKTTTINYLIKLLQTESITVGSFVTPHFSTYNERLAINNVVISNQRFEEIANIVFNAMQTHNIHASSKEILTAMSLIYFNNKKVNVILIEQENMITYDPVMIYSPRILGITRIVTDTKEIEHAILQQITAHLTTNVFVVSSDQSKILLQKLAILIEQKKALWIMPIRKLAPLAYPFEQLHGRCAALAERIAQLYIEEISIRAHNTPSFLRTIKKQRGRPSLITQQSRHDNNLQAFWNNTKIVNKSFQIINQQKCTIIISNASNIDALKNVLLGIRLLNYQKPWKNISIIFGTLENHFNEYDFVKIVRYFFKKNSGNLIICPIESNTTEEQGASWNTDSLMIAAQNAKIKISYAKNFKSAYEDVIKNFNDAQDLLVITGSQTIVANYCKEYKESI